MKKLLLLAALLAALLLGIAAARAENLLKNPTFDEDSAYWETDMWITQGDVTLATWTPDGKSGGGLSIENRSKNDARFVQTVSVEPQTTYLLSGYVRTDGAIPEGGAGLSIIGYTNARAHVENTRGKWKRMELYFKTKAGQSSVTVAARVGFYSADTAGAAQFDELSLTKVSEVPKSATLILLENDSAQASGSEVSSASWSPIAVPAAALLVLLLLVLHARRVRRRVRYEQPAPAGPVRFTRRELLCLLALTVVYAFVAFYHLGDTRAPQSEWRGSEAVLDLGGTQSYTVMLYPGINWPASTDVYFEVSDDGESWSFAGQAAVEDGDCFTWRHVRRAVFGEDGSVTGWQSGEQVFTSRYLRLTSADVALMEIGLHGEDGALLYATAPNARDAALCDETELVPDAPSYMNSMYFDEIYHGRTAYELLHGLSIYEWTHPPLGKELMALGVGAFGMTPFGWRFTGTLMGVLMLPAIFLLARLLFGKPFPALMAAFLLAFDEMHLAQTRIATIDSYAVLFILLMTACMVRYMQMNLLIDGNKTLVPLGLSGLFMGLACASKWTGAYGGLGLAVLFFWVVARRAAEVARARRSLSAKEAAALRTLLVRRLAVTFGCCVVFFIIVPFVIYYLSYIPHFTAAGGLTPSRFIHEQERMFNYHSGLTGSHSYESRWFDWPLGFRPVWYYSGGDMPEGFVSTILCFGNIAIWWPSAVALIALAVLWLRGVLSRKAVEDYTPAIILIGFLAQLVPWMFIERMTFLYHYFPSLVFAILALVYFISRLRDCLGKRAYILIALYALVVLVFFALFYPFATGEAMTRTYATAMNWLRKLNLPWWPFSGWLRY